MSSTLSTASAIIAAAKRTGDPRAVFVLRGSVQHLPAWGADAMRLERSHPSSLVGLYDRRCIPAELASDLIAAGAGQ